MSIKHDYILDMISEFTDTVLAGMGKTRAGLSRDALRDYEAIVGRALDMDAATLLALSPESLVTMVRLSAVDESLAVYAVFALQRAAEIYEASGDATGQLRRAQAQAVAGVYGFAVDAVPSEVEQALSEQG